MLNRRLFIVIGTILMIIASLGASGCVTNDAKVVSTTVRDEGNHGLITWQGGSDLSNIVYWEATANGELVAGGRMDTPRVEQQDYTIAPIAGERLTIAATFSDGTQQIIYDKQFDSGSMTTSSIGSTPAQTPLATQIVTPVQTLLPTTTQMSVFSMGDTVEIGNYQITLNSAHWDAGDPYFPPEPGTRFLVVDCTLKNTGNKPVTISSYMMFDLIDKDGYSLERGIFVQVRGSLDAIELGVGRNLRGQIAYIVDESDRGPWELVFTPELLRHGQVIFKFSASDVR